MWSVIYLTIAFCSCLLGNLRIAWVCKVPSPLEFYFLSSNKAGL